MTGGAALACEGGAIARLAHPPRGHLINQTTEATAVGGGGGAVIISPARRAPSGKLHRDRLSVSAAMSPQHPSQVFGIYAVAVPGNLEPSACLAFRQPSGRESPSQ